MSDINKIYNEIFKILPIIDLAFDDLINRKDNGITIGKFVVEKDEAFESISISLPYHSYAKNKSILQFSSSTDINRRNISNFETLQLSTTSDICMIEYTKGDDHYMNFDYGPHPANCSIPYDRSASIEERKMSIDISVDHPLIRDFMYKVVDIQSMDLKSVTVVEYNFNNIVELMSGAVYNSLIKHVYFKRLLKDKK